MTVQIERGSKGVEHRLNLLAAGRNQLIDENSREAAAKMVFRLNQCLSHFYANRKEWSAWQATRLAVIEGDCDRAMVPTGLGYAIEFQSPLTGEVWNHYSYTNSIQVYHKFRRIHPHGWDGVIVRVILD